MTGSAHGPERAVDWASLAGPIGAAAPWRPADPHPSRAPQAAPGTDGDNWAGRGFTRPGPEPDAEAEAGT